MTSTGSTLRPMRHDLPPRPHAMRRLRNSLHPNPPLQMRPPRHAALRLEGPGQEERDLRRATMRAVHDVADGGEGPLPEACRGV